MDVFTQEFILIALGFVGNCILLIIGAVIAKYTVSQYQRSKDVNFIRENLLDLNMEVILNLSKFLGTLTQYIGELNIKLKDPNFEEDLFSLLTIEKELFGILGEYKAHGYLLLARMHLQLKLNERQNDIVNNVDIFQTKIWKEISAIIFIIEKLRSGTESEEKLNEMLNRRMEEVRNLDELLTKSYNLSRVILTAQVSI